MNDETTPRDVPNLAVILRSINGLITRLRTAIFADEPFDDAKVDVLNAALIETIESVAGPLADFVNALDSGWGGGNSTTEFTRAYVQALDSDHQYGTLFGVTSTVDVDGLIRALQFASLQLAMRTSAEAASPVVLSDRQRIALKQAADTMTEILAES